MVNGKSKELEIINYYRSLYSTYIPYICERLCDDSLENVYGDIKEGRNAIKFTQLGHNFSMYMLRVDKLGLHLTEKLLGVFLYTQICSYLGNGGRGISEEEQLYGVIQIAKLMLDDIKGKVKISGLTYPLVSDVQIDVEDGVTEEVKRGVVVYPPEGYSMSVKERWDGVLEYSMHLKDGYSTSRVDIEAIDSNSDGTEIITLGDKNFDKRGILSYRIKGDVRGEVVVKYWSIMFKEVLEYFKEHRREEFLEIVERQILRGKRKVFVKYGDDGMDAPKHIGEGIYIEGHTSPNQIKTLLSILFVDLGLSLDDLEVCVKEGKNVKGQRRSM